MSTCICVPQTPMFACAVLAREKGTSKGDGRSIPVASAALARFVDCCHCCGRCRTFPTGLQPSHTPLALTLPVLYSRVPYQRGGEGVHWQKLLARGFVCCNFTACFFALALCTSKTCSLLAWGLILQRGLWTVVCCVVFCPPWGGGVLTLPYGLPAGVAVLPATRGEMESTEEGVEGGLLDILEMRSA